MKVLNSLAATLVIIGALNWGLVALAEFDLVAEIFGLEFGETNAANARGLWPRRSSRRVRASGRSLRLAAAPSPSLEALPRLADGHPSKRERTNGVYRLTTLTALVAIAAFAIAALGPAASARPRRARHHRRDCGRSRPVQDARHAAEARRLGGDLAARRALHRVRTDGRCLQEGAEFHAQRSTEGQSQAAGSAPVPRHRRKGDGGEGRQALLGEDGERRTHPYSGRWLQRLCEQLEGDESRCNGVKWRDSRHQPRADSKRLVSSTKGGPPDWVALPCADMPFSLSLNCHRGVVPARRILPHRAPARSGRGMSDLFQIRLTIVGALRRIR